MGNIFIRTGLAPYRIDTYNELNKRLNMKMCFYYREGGDQMHDFGLLESQCRFKPIYLAGRYFGSDNRKWCKGLWKLLRKERPEVVIVPEFQISSLQVLLYRWLSFEKFKVVSMTDDSYDMIVNNNDFTRLHKWLRTHFARFFDGFIVATPEVEQWYQVHYDNGIWMPIIMNEKKMITYYARLLPLSQKYVDQYNLANRKVLLSVSRLVELKNLHRVIDAFARANTDAILVIVGDGPESGALVEHARKVNKEIVFTGRFDGDKLYAWYNLASVFILASYLEPFGATTNEALLAGCRMIVSEKAGSSCLVDKTNGEIIDPMNVDGIAAAIDRQMALSPIPDLVNSRKSLMTVSFEERIDNLVKKIEALMTV